MYSLSRSTVIHSPVTKRASQNGLTFRLAIFFLVLSAAAAMNWKDTDINRPSEMKLRRQAPAMCDLEALKNGLGSNKPTPIAEANKEYWLQLAKDELEQRTLSPLNTKQAKNVILFLGDGMGMTTVTAARIRKGQLKGNNGEEDQLSFEKFPYAGFSRTYCTDAQVADSACTSTAYMCGVKANFLTLGVNARVNFNNCSESNNPDNHVSSILAWAQKAGKSTGFITTTTLTHATPGGGYAHTASRLWESDTDITRWTNGKVDPAECMDIAQQLVTQEPGNKFDVMFGGGMGKFLPNTVKDAHGNMGERSDGKNLLDQWLAEHSNGRIVTDRAGLLNLNHEDTSPVMGLFQSKYMDFHALANNTQQPTLEEMTEVAIKLLSKNEKGFVVLIEGGLIDVANHANLAVMSLDETLEMDKAVKKGHEMTDRNNTLMVVTADHSHPLSIGGFSERGSDILGVSPINVDRNCLNYATLNYAAGSQQYLDERGERLKLNDIFATHDPLLVYPSYINKPGGVHAGEDVGVYASGPYEHLFRGVMEQSTLPHMMAYAACIGDGLTMCTKK